MNGSGEIAVGKNTFGRWEVIIISYDGEEKDVPAVKIMESPNKYLKSISKFLGSFHLQPKLIQALFVCLVGATPYDLEEEYEFEDKPASNDGMSEFEYSTEEEKKKLMRDDGLSEDTDDSNEPPMNKRRRL